MPAGRAASSREAPSSTRASIRREAAVSRHRLASRRSSTAPSSFRVIATVMAPPPIGHTADQPRQAPRGSERDDASAIRAVGMTPALEPGGGAPGDDRALGFGERGGDVEHEPAARGGGVDRLGQRAQPDLAPLEVLDGLDQPADGAG